MRPLSVLAWIAALVVGALATLVVCALITALFGKTAGLVAGAVIVIATLASGTSIDISLVVDKRIR